MRNTIRSIVDVVDTFRLTRISRTFINLISRQNYAHSLNWFGVKIFQTPTDLFLYQQLVFRAKPTVIIETGVAKGGSVLFACQILDLLHGASNRNNWRVICSDINSLDEAKKAIFDFGYEKNVEFYRGDSAGEGFRNLISKVLLTLSNPRVLLSLDSKHTEEHVYNELVSLSRFVSLESYAVVWDSRIHDLSSLTHFLRPRAWNKKKHAGTGLLLFLKSQEVSKIFVVDSQFEDNLLICGTKSGVLRKVEIAQK
jgi:cephalosporin hydroxylase